MKLTSLYLGVAGLFFICMAVTSCDVSHESVAPSNELTVYDVPAVNEGQRFTVTKHGKFDAGFGNNTREIVIITDTQTKRTYLGVTGVGVTEMRSESTTSTDMEGNITTDTTTTER